MGKLHFPDNSECQIRLLQKIFGGLERSARRLRTKENGGLEGGMQRLHTKSRRLECGLAANKETTTPVSRIGSRLFAKRCDPGPIVLIKSQEAIC